MKEYFRLLVESKDHNTPKLLDNIMPTGKFFIHPDTHMVMHGSGDHNDIAKKYLLRDTNTAQFAGWVRGNYSNKLLALEGYHGHEAMRRVLSKFSSLLPNDTRFIIDNYDPEDAVTVSKEFTGIEKLKKYIEGGNFVPTQTHATVPTNYDVDKRLRSTIPPHERVAESFTFSKLRTQSNEESSIIRESWQEYNSKVGETNTSLFEPNNKKFNMKSFLKKLRKKYNVMSNLPGENY